MRSIYARIGTTRLNIGSLSVRDATRSNIPTGGTSVPEQSDLSSRSPLENLNTTTSSSSRDTITAFHDLLPLNVNRWLRAWFNGTRSLRKLDLSWMSLSLVRQFDMSQYVQFLDNNIPSTCLGIEKSSPESLSRVRSPLFSFTTCEPSFP